MALGAKTTEGAKGWTEGTLMGFKESKAGTHYIVHFQLTTGEFCSMPFGLPIKLSELNPLMIAFGLKPFDTAGEITLPEIGDADMMGMDTPISINVIQKGDFINAKGFRALDAESKPPF